MIAGAPTKWADVDVGALRDNTVALRRFLGEDCLVMAMVKANGYGHGAVLAARAALAGGASWLGVSSIGEGIELRRAGLSARILNVGWTPADDMEIAAHHDIDVSLFDVESVGAMQRAARRSGHTTRVHWKLDTGMGRLGTPLDAVPKMRDALRSANSDVTVAGLFTHFACADADSLNFTHRQHQRFSEFLAGLRGIFPGAIVHTANSAALLRLRETHHDMTRPGIALYGYPPRHCEGVVHVRPALTVSALITQVKRVAAGDGVGYGQEWTASRDSMVATLAAGYADGIDRRNGNNGHVVVNGVLCPIIGRVSMDQTAVDISEADGVASGTVATLLGRTVPDSVDAAAVAARIGTIPNEVLCAVTARVPRVAVNGNGIID